LPLGQVWTPALPVGRAGSIVCEAERLGIAALLPVTQKMRRCGHVVTQSISWLRRSYHGMTVP
jgi:hypothetical protein